MATPLPSAVAGRLDTESTAVVPSCKGLHEGHRACLELVAKGMSTKEIARATGLAPSSVDTYLKQAISVLGATNRRQAARTYLDMITSQKLGSPSAPLPSRPEVAPTPNLSGGWRWRDLLAPPPIGGTPNELGWREKTLHILQVAIFAAASVLGLTLTIAGFYRILQ
jgi:DNA-binding CsgD family transcriptional regulator